jgi:YggT family protein
LFGGIFKAAPDIRQSGPAAGGGYVLRTRPKVKAAGTGPSAGRSVSACLAAGRPVALHHWLETRSRFMRLVLQVVDTALSVYLWVIFAVAVMAWLKGFKLIDAANGIVVGVDKFLTGITEPALIPLRYVVPVRNGVDPTPLVSIMILMAIQYLILIYILPAYS